MHHFFLVEDLLNFYNFRPKRNKDPEVQLNAIDSVNTSTSSTESHDVSSDVINNEVSSGVINRYRMKLRYKSNLLCKYKKQNRILKQKVLRLEKQIEQIIKHNSNDGISVVCNQFMDSQLRHMNRHKMGRRYENGDKELALALYYCSTKSYVLLQKFFCLPSLSSLRSWLNNLHVGCGLNACVLDLLKIKSEKLMRAEKVVSLVFDEMALQEHLNYDARRDVFEGFEDYGDQRQNDAMKMCNHAMVIMIKGLYVNFKQVIGYYLSREAMSADSFKEIFLDIIKNIQDTGFIIKTVVCDLGTNNVRLRKLLSVSVEDPYITLNGEKIYFFFDTPHLLKCLRNNFKKYDFLHEDKICSWSHVVNFHAIDSKQIPRMAPKLTKKSIILPPFSPMRVCLATNVFSHSVHAGILCNVTLNNLPARAIHTADFIDKIDTLFDIFNSAKYSDKMYRKPISVQSNHHMAKLGELKKYLTEVIVLNKRLINPLCIKGWISNINALQLLWNDLKTNFNFQFLFTRRITQDCVENLFSVIRYKGGNNVTPDSTKFRCSLRSVMANQLLQPSIDSNSEVDACSFLLQKQEISNQIINVSTKCSKEDSSISYSKYNLAEKNSECYVLGWVCSQLPHEDCRNALCSLTNNFDIVNTQIELKKYTESSKMYFPNEMSKKASDILNETFKRLIDNFLMESVSNVKAKLISNCNIKENMLNVCDSCYDLFLDKYVNVLIKAFVNQKNENNKARLKTSKNIKLKKITHN